jgi:hypothetical protein
MTPVSTFLLLLQIHGYFYGCSYDMPPIKIIDLILPMLVNIRIVFTRVIFRGDSCFFFMLLVFVCL